MIALGAAGICWIGGSAAAALLHRRDRVANGLALVTTLSGALFLAAAALSALRGPSSVWEVARILPFGVVSLRLDPIAAVFMLPLALVGALAGVYAPAYSRLSHGSGRSALHLAGLQLLLSAMALVLLAANTVLLLLAWELVTLTSWALLAGDHRDRAVRAAGLGYLVAGHVSGAALALLFVLLAQAGGGWHVPVAPIAAAGVSSAACCVLALLGFGTKAAIAPLHVWLPDAHAAAPSHISALMSGVLVTLGFYGLARFLPVLAGDPRPWALTLMALGALGAAGGIVMALSQRDVKRVLAYSTIENAGLVAIAIGLALFAGASGDPALAELAWTAALLHLWNHAIAKSALFLGAGGLAAGVGSRDLELWGGLLRRLPVTGGALLVGSAAMAGLPGTNVFASEWLLILSLFRGAASLTGPGRAMMLLGLIAVTFAAGAALACFVRLVGIGLLGHPRSVGAAEPRPGGARLEIAIVVPAALCLALVAGLSTLLAILAGAAAQLAHRVSDGSVARLAAPLPWLALLPLGATLAFVLQRVWLARARRMRKAMTWDCGYALPSVTMQYTATSLSQPLTSLLQPALRTAVRASPPAGLWPAALSWESQTPERALVEFYRPAFRRVAELLGAFRQLHAGRVTVYLRYLAAALLVLVAWLFWPAGTPR